MADEPQLTVIGHITAALGWLRSVDYVVKGARTSLSDARELAVKEHKPTDQIVALQRDLEALDDLVSDQVNELIRKMAEVEAGSKG